MYEDDCGDCSDVLKDIAAYLDGELAAGEVSRIREHLSGCSPCMSHAEFRKHLKALIARKCGCDEVPASLTDRIRASLEDPATR